MVQPFIDTDHPAEPGDGGIGRFPEKIHAHTKQDRIQDARDHDPLPQLMFGDELMRFSIRLEGYNNFFEQLAFLLVLSD